MKTGFILILLIGAVAGQGTGLLQNVGNLLGDVLGGVGELLGVSGGGLLGSDGLIPVGGLLGGLLGGLIGRDGLLPVVGNAVGGLVNSLGGVLGELGASVDDLLPVLDFILGAVLSRLGGFVAGTPASQLDSDFQRALRLFRRSQRRN